MTKQSYQSSTQCEIQKELLALTNDPEACNIIALGGGRQSLYMTEMILAENPQIRIDGIIFSDTGDEPSGVYEQINKWSERWFQLYKKSVIKVSAGTISTDIADYLDGIKKRASAVPLRTAPNGGMLWRQCTNDYKIRPLKRTARKIMKAYGKKRVNLMLGIALDEIERMKPSPVKYIRHLYPLIAWQKSTNEIVKWYAYKGFGKVHKSSCTFCPYHSNKHWAEMKAENGIDWHQAVAFDKAIREYPTAKGKCYLHRSLKPLDEIDFVTENQKRPELIEECDGYCTT